MKRMGGLTGADVEYHVEPINCPHEPPKLDDLLNHLASQGWTLHTVSTYSHGTVGGIFVFWRKK